MTKKKKNGRKPSLPNLKASNLMRSKLFTKSVADLTKVVKAPKRSRHLLVSGIVEVFHKDLLKYWKQRYNLFSRFDDGIKMDREALFSVTPEVIARHQADQCGSNGVVIDAFSGVGGNAIQFALRCDHVIAIDINRRRSSYARHNAGIYGVTHEIDFIVGDFFQLAPSLKADIIFLSPPWGGPDYKRVDKYDIETMLEPKNGFCLFSLALSVAPSIVLFLPRTVDKEQLEQLAWLSNPPLSYEVENNFLNGRLKGVTVYYGEIANRITKASDLNI